MKTKIIERFKAKFGVNIPNKRLEEIFGRLESKITDETEIDARLEEWNEFYPFAELAKAYDDAARLANAKPKPVLQEAKEPVYDPPQGSTEPFQDAPAWAKALMDSNKALQAQVSDLSKEKIAAGRIAALKEVLNGSADFFVSKTLKDFARMTFENREAFDEYLQEVKDAQKDLVQISANANLGKDKPLTALGGQPDGQELSELEKEIFETMKTKKIN